MMKDIQYLLTLTLLILLSGCSSDDVSDIIGTWGLFQLTVDCPVDGEFYDFRGNNGCYSDAGSEACFYLNFREDGTGSVTTSFEGESESSEMTYSQSNDQVTVCWAPSECETFQLSDGKLTFETLEEGCNASYIFSK